MMQVLSSAWAAFRRLAPRAQAIIGGPVAFVFILLCVAANGAHTAAATHTTTTPRSTAAPVPPLAEHLTFSGDIAGTLTQGVHPLALSHTNPPATPNATQCADFAVSGVGQDYVGMVVGQIGTKHYAVSVEINEDDPAYTSPGTPLMPGDTNSGGSVAVYELGAAPRQWQQVYGPSGQEAAVIVLGADRRSGTVDAWMASSDLSQKGTPATLHLQGNWRCG